MNVIGLVGDPFDERVPGSRLHDLPGIGRLPFLEAPAGTARAIRGLVEICPAGDA